MPAACRKSLLQTCTVATTLLQPWLKIRPRRDDARAAAPPRTSKSSLILGNTEYQRAWCCVHLARGQAQALAREHGPCSELEPLTPCAPCTYAHWLLCRAPAFIPRPARHERVAIDSRQQWKAGSTLVGIATSRDPTTKQPQSGGASTQRHTSARTQRSPAAHGAQSPAHAPASSRARHRTQPNLPQPAPQTGAMSHRNRKMLLKVIILGDQGVGKTSLMNQYVTAPLLLCCYFYYYQARVLLLPLLRY